MFGDRHTLCVILCNEHAGMDGVQESLRKVLDIVKDNPIVPCTCFGANERDLGSGYSIAHKCKKHDGNE
jgi:hypothetical protein